MMANKCYGLMTRWYLATNRLEPPARRAGDTLEGREGESGERGSILFRALEADEVFDSPHAAHLACHR